ncbi:MAG: TraR/DksA C4-type zinc finger protein [Gemmatimonadota bacterium]
MTSRLTAEQVEELRAELTRSLERLNTSMKTTSRAARPVKLDQTTVGRLSRMDALQNQHMTKGLQERENAKAALLADALERLDSGEFGVCEECGGGIQFERLLLFPETRACSACLR